MDIREATIRDVPGITEIYNDAVLSTTAIWNETEVDHANRMTWLEDHQQSGFPVLVAVEDHDVLGYATFGQWRNWEGYRHTVEHSVYVREDQRGRGLGRRLMMELIHEAREAGAHVMVAAVESENTGSVALHQKLGFEQVGHLKQVGTKFGRWLDLTFLQLMLDEDPAPAA